MLENIDPSWYMSVKNSNECEVNDGALCLIAGVKIIA